MRVCSRFVFMAGLLILAAGCAPAPVAAPPPLASAVPTVVPSPLPPTPTPLPEAPPVPSPSPSPQQPLAAKVNVVSLNLRDGPGTLFEVLGTYALDTQVTALGRAPGDDWIEIEEQGGRKGWVFADLLDMEGELQTLPVLEVPESLTIAGKVIDSNGRPINGVQIQITARLFRIAVQFVTRSADDGTFYAYFPPDTAGVWQVELIGTDCDSRIVDGNCNVVEYFPYNDSAYVQLPALSPLVFVYEEASEFITGTVQDAEGQPVGNMRVFATRSDGASSAALSGNTGVFVLPASSGAWQVYAVQLTPYLEGERVRVQVTAGSQPDPVLISVPQAGSP